MRKLYNEFFCIPQDGKIREKVMVTRIISTIAVIVLCLVAMSFTAYAYFSHDITSNASVIRGAHFETKVSIQITDQEGKVVDINPVTSNYQRHKIELESGKTYTVTISPTENSNATTGFVIVSAANCAETYHTQQLGVDANAVDGATSAITFKLSLTETAEVQFLAHWGTSSYYDDFKNKGANNELYITHNEEINLNVIKVENKTEVKEPNE